MQKNYNIPTLMNITHLPTNNLKYIKYSSMKTPQYIVVRYQKTPRLYQLKPLHIVLCIHHKLTPNYI